MNTLENDITEAIFAAEDALQHLYQAKKYLKKASNWGIFDIFAGGFITSMIKHNHIDNAQDEIQYAKVALENLSRELQDVDDYIKVGFTEQLRLKSRDLIEFVDKMVESFYKTANVYAVPLFSEPTMSLDYYPTLKFTTEYEPHRDFVGFAFATRDEIYRWYDTKRITKSIERDILDMVNYVLAIYNDYLKGATYHYVIETADGTEIDRGLDFYELDGDTDKMLELMLKGSSVYDKSFVEI